MAQNPGGNQGGQGTQPPKQPKNVVAATPGPISETPTGYTFAVRVRVTCGPRVVTGQNVRVLSGVNELGQLSLDPNGECVYTHNELATSAGKVIDLTFRLQGDPAEVSLQATMPAKAEKKNTGPETMTVWSSHDGAGNYTLTTRVVGVDDKGIATKVSIIENGQVTKVDTDTEGLATYVVSTPLVEGENRKVRCTVNGIKPEASMTLRRRKPKAVLPAPSGKWQIFCDKVGWRTNNGRARWIWYLFLVATVVMVCVGVGGSYLGPKELTSQQILENRVHLLAYDKPLYVAVEKSEPNVGLWAMYFAFALFTIGYGIASLREEFAEAVVQTVNKLLDKDHTYVSDPMFVRLANWAGAMAVVKNATVKASATSDGGEKTNTGKMGMSFSKLVSAEFLGEILAELAPRILSRIF